jgi:O-succinylbenzoic acid--CoA ligase
MQPDKENQKTQAEYDEFLLQWKSSESSILQHTSGSTGKPKQIKISKAMMKASAQMTGDYFQLKAGQKALLCISPKFIGGKMMLVRAECYHLELITTGVSSTPLKNLTQSIDFAAMVPLQVSETLKQHPEKLDLIRYLIIGGAPVSKELEVALQSTTCQAYSTYGMTETVSHIALKKLDNTDAPFIGIGRSSFTTKDDCLVITSPELGIDMLQTNDVVELENEHAFRWIGRSDFTINSGGIKLQPEAIEEKLAKILPKEKFIISSLDDDKLGQKVILIAANELSETYDEKKVNNVLERFEIPKKVYFVNTIERTANGKIDRLATSKLIHER